MRQLKRTGKNEDDCHVSVRKLQLCLFWDGDFRLRQRDLVKPWVLLRLSDRSASFCARSPKQQFEMCMGFKKSIDQALN
ncbi:hypothetical protein P5673_004628 [Acropora cervicornis]|uniref:Uncharacterized protein n=1 Tax=Acropora cervicornis TaxID=6130 RepID=A0AAD9R0L2_ACRCE|nr:hypothetical protein P5673_004628 [Acropora cervicornis]